MAVIKGGVLMGDGKAATIRQVLEVVKENPPVRLVDIAHPCFPGYMVSAKTPDDWKKRLRALIDEVDSRVVVLNQCNAIWRKVSPKPKQEVKLYRADDRRPLPEMPDWLLDMEFRDIEPGYDPKLTFDRFGKHYIECKGG